RRGCPKWSTSSTEGDPGVRTVPRAIDSGPSRPRVTGQRPGKGTGTFEAPQASGEGSKAQVTVRLATLFRCFVRARRRTGKDLLPGHDSVREIAIDTMCVECRGANDPEYSRKHVWCGRFY